MRPYSLLFLLLTGLVSACNFGSYPSGGSQSPSGGQQSPDDTYPGSPSGGNQSPSRYPSGGGQSPSRYPSGGDQSPSQQPGNYPSSPGRSRSADPGVTVNDIRLTPQYTILNLTFTNKNQVQRDRNGQVMNDPREFISFDPAGQLVAANGARKFNFVRVEGIPLKSGQVRYNQQGQRITEGMVTSPGQQVTFTLYFERLDKGLESFDLFECNNSDLLVCWNIYNLFVNNPADVIVYNPPTPVPPKPSSPLPQPSGQSGGETRAEPAPKPLPAPATLAVTGVVSDAKTRRPVTATINYQLSASKKSVDSVQSFASTGAYRLSLLRGQVYTYIVSARGYQASSGVLDVSKITGSQTVTRNIELTPLAVGDKITLKNVYFELSKSDLLSASYAELDKLVAMMKDNPNMAIRLEGHTDIIGDHAKNLQLSQDRVLACERYLVQKGIDTDRIQTIGYGDTRPITTKGTDEDRKINRRVEFDILTL